MAVVWREKMRIGHTQIDDDHKYLVRLVNVFEEAVTRGAKKHAVMGVFYQLYAYTQEHFDREEKIQVAANYPYYEVHRKEHQEIIGRLSQLKDNLEAEQNAEASGKVIAEACDLLRDWLLVHILETDRRMIPYVSNTG